MNYFRKKHVQHKKELMSAQNHFDFQLPQIFECLIVAEHICKVSHLRTNFQYNFYKNYYKNLTYLNY